jgi:hypothetical protein
MVGPMREKRAWPALERDSDGETVAAFEAAVAVVKETVVRSGEVLVSAKEDLSDHQRWLKAQTAAVQADRERHERWLQRQRERQEALERREERRARRRALRQAFLRSITGAISRAVLSVRSAIDRVVATIVGALNSLRNWVVGGVISVGVGLSALARSAIGAVSRSLRYAGEGVHRILGRAGDTFRLAGAWTAAKLHALAPSIADFLAVSFRGLGARASESSRSITGRLTAAFAWLGAKTAALIGAAGEALAPASDAIVTRAYALSPSLWDMVDQSGRAAKRHIQGLWPAAKASPTEAENAVFSDERVRGFELSQMLVIAGTILLVCGALMLGGGLILRAKTPSSLIADTSASEPIAWLFEHKDFPLDERSIFEFAVTPEGVRIKGFSIGAVNMSDGPITSLDGVIKPDRHGEELKLSLVVERPGEPAEGANAAEAPPIFAPAGSIPAQAPFKLLFPFPGAEGTSGMTPEEARKESSGVLLKVHYVIDGKHRAFIHYLPLALLEEQLAEIQAAASGS